jgi:diketogulonate reductase-like aldo/keto reductase
MTTTTLERPAAPIIHANGAAIPALGLGTVDLKGDAGIETVATALRLGYRHLDGARKYWTEKEVGGGMRASGVPRSEIMLTTKVSHENLHTGDFANSVEGSLKDLQVDYVDLLLVHWPNPAIPLAETMQALAKTKRDGLARHVGVANFTTTLIEEAVRLCPESLVCNQFEFHPYIDQRKLHAACRRHGMAVIGYCPFMRSGPVLQDPIVAAIAKAHGKTQTQTILRWITQNDGVAPIPRWSNPERLAQNLAIFDFTLTPDEFERIGALRSHHQRIANPPHSPVWDTL